MPLPFIALASIAAMGGGATVAAMGAYAMRWYERLSPEDKIAADEKALDMARRMGKTKIIEVNPQEAKDILSVVSKNSGSPSAKHGNMASRSKKKTR